MSRAVRSARGAVRDGPPGTTAASRHAPGPGRTAAATGRRRGAGDPRRRAVAAAVAATAASASCPAAPAADRAARPLPLGRAASVRGARGPRQTAARQAPGARRRPSCPCPGAREARLGTCALRRCPPPITPTLPRCAGAPPPPGRRRPRGPNVRKSMELGCRRSVRATRERGSARADSVEQQPPSRLGIRHAARSVRPPVARGREGPRRTSVGAAPAFRAPPCTAGPGRLQGPATCRTAARDRPSPLGPCPPALSPF